MPEIDERMVAVRAIVLHGARQLLTQYFAAIYPREPERQAQIEQVMGDLTAAIGDGDKQSYGMGAYGHG
jgi:hypothetical protein